MAIKRKVKILTELTGIRGNCKPSKLQTDVLWGGGKKTIHKGEPRAPTQ